MDAGYINENGYVFVTARDDDVINVAGHRISTASLGTERFLHPITQMSIFKSLHRGRSFTSS